MKKVWSEIWNNHYGNTEWNLAKVSLIFIWFVKSTTILLTYQSAPIPAGIFTWFDFAFIENPIWRYLIILLNITFSGMYLFEKRMTVSTMCLFVISVFTFSLEESNGILNRYSLLSFLFFAQYLAYQIGVFYPKLDYTQLRFTFSIQAIAATYILSAISKLSVSGIFWASSSKYLPLQILKSHQYKYVTNADIDYVNTGNKLASFVQENHTLITALLTISLLLELFAWLSIGSKKRALLYGCLLMLMHIGINWLMDIRLIGISRPMYIFLVNPLFIIWVAALNPLFKLVKNR